MSDPYIVVPAFRAAAQYLAGLKDLWLELYDDCWTGGAGSGSRGRVRDANPTQDLALDPAKEAQRAEVDHLSREVEYITRRLENAFHRAERIGGARGGVIPKSHSVTEDEGHAAADRADKMHRKWERRLYPKREPA